MSGGGSETVTQETKLPDWITDAAKSNIERADAISQIGYVPNMLPQVAAFAPGQEAAFQNTNDMASAFGLGSGGGQSYLPQAETYANGVKGYNTWDLAQQGIDKLAKERPGQYEAITSMFINPFTGEGGTFADNPLSGGSGTSGGSRIDNVGDPSRTLENFFGSSGTPLNEWGEGQVDAAKRMFGGFL